jgi:hypothetical protein
VENQKNGRQRAAHFLYAGRLSFSKQIEAMLHITDFTGCEKRLSGWISFQQKTECDQHE